MSRAQLTAYINFIKEAEAKRLSWNERIKQSYKWKDA